MTNDYLLNPEQCAAVSAAADGGAVLILAGAGTGKTTTLIAAVAALFPGKAYNILSVTFTNKAAREIKNRIFDACGETPYWCGTFHSVCLKILRRERAAAGMRADFLVFGEDDQKKVLKSVFSELNLDSDDYDAGNWVEIIALYKETVLFPFAGEGVAAGGTQASSNDKLRPADGVVVNGKNGRIQIDHYPVTPPYSDASRNKTPGRATPSQAKGIKTILAAYNAELARLNAVDFADIINHTNNLFIDNPKILEKYQDLFRYILVDEFQDTNAPQYTLLRLLAAKYGNICCVGDDDQSIYSWRGAQIANILNFQKDFPGARVFRLTQNYRSTSNILSAANSLIKNNANRLGKDLWSGLGAGEKVKVITFASDYEEAATIANAIANDNTRKKSDFAILIRNGSLSKKFEDEFISRQVPYILTGAQKFYDRAEIQDVIAYLRVLMHRFDDMSFLRIIAKPRRGFGDKAIAELREYARRTNKSLFDALREIPLKPKQRIAADEFISAFDFNPQSMSPENAAMKIINDSGYLAMWQNSNDDTAGDRIKNVYELINGTISKYDSMDEFLENASLMVADDGPESNTFDATDAVNIMTIHAAKGLEFDTVFMPAWEEGIFPNEMAINEGGLEEERRLAYVAITRAKRRAVITNAMSRMVYGQRAYNSPSRFIGEIDGDFIDDGKIKQRHLSNSIVGKLVRHDELGGGVVIEDAGDILTIAFRDRGIKKVARKFVVISS